MSWIVWGVVTCVIMLRMNPGGIDVVQRKGFAGEGMYSNAIQNHNLVSTCRNQRIDRDIERAEAYARHQLLSVTYIFSFIHFIRCR